MNRIRHRFIQPTSTVRASSSSARASAYPFPAQRDPTPHEIFHLPLSASERDIKARYYDLVREHHPDSAVCAHLSCAERHERFQAIGAAYDRLRGRRNDVWEVELARRQRAWGGSSRGARPRATYDGGREREAEKRVNGDERWKDQIMVVVGVLTLAAGLYPGLFLFPSRMEKRHREAVENLAEARREAREFGLERRQQIRKRLLENKVA